MSIKDSLHQYAFDRIFKDYEWPTMASQQHQASLFLIGEGLMEYYLGSRDDTYLMVFADDMTGDLRMTKARFLASLQPHTQVGDYEIRFERTRLTLNVHSIFVNLESSKVDPMRLFSGKKAWELGTKYLCWNDRGSAPTDIPVREMHGPFSREGGREEIRDAADPEFWCEMRLACSEKGEVECAVEAQTYFGCRE